MSVNPYNFISLSGKCNRPSIKDNEKTYTGTMSCTLTTKTPLFIPRNSPERVLESSEKDIEFFSYDFTSDNPKPVIPGSSIRGVIRSCYEALTEGCLSTAVSDLVLYRRTLIAKKPGIIEKHVNEKGETVYELYAAERVMLYTGDLKPTQGGSGPFGIKVNKQEYCTGDKVFFDVVKKNNETQYFEHYNPNAREPKYEYQPLWLRVVSDIQESNPGNYEKGIVLIGEGYNGKHHDSVFVKKSGAKPVDVTSSYSNLVKVWRLYQFKKNGGVQEGDEDRETYKGYFDADPLPVFYDKAPGENYYYLSPACITKEAFHNTILKILKSQGGYQPCDNKTGYCEACQIFGLVDGMQAIASRVRISDAVTSVEQVSYEDWYEKKRNILMGGPKITATEFYMDDAGGALFNYDYSLTYTGKQPNDPVEVAPRIRGRKFYWHSDRQINAPDDPNKKMFKCIHPVKEGKQFRFTIDFDRLNAEQLSKLKFAVALTFKDESEHAHKLGHGKPIGYGSVSICVDKIEAFLVNDDFELVSVDIPSIDWEPEQTLSILELKSITDWTKRPADVGYPQINGDTRQWFAMNKKVEIATFSPAFSNVLPYILSANLSLPEQIIRYSGNRVPIGNEKRNGFGIKATSSGGLSTDGLSLNKTTTKDEVKNQRSEQEQIKKINELCSKAGKPAHAYDKSKKDANAKLRKFLDETPEPEAESEALKKAFADAKKKLENIT